MLAYSKRLVAWAALAAAGAQLTMPWDAHQLSNADWQREAQSAFQQRPPAVCSEEARYRQHYWDLAEQGWRTRNWFVGMENWLALAAI
jgi:hypothetical protein